MTDPTPDASAQLGALQHNLGQALVGDPLARRLALVPLLAGGHLLIEDVPGVGKTTLAKALAGSIGGDFRRIQFTADLLPMDLTGSAVFNQKTSDFEFRPGPLFCDVLLADELNRATPRTQSALLEAMEERQVSIDGETRSLGEIFFVVATINPVEQAGTFELPESQLDRFMLRLSLGYPSATEETRIFDLQREAHPLSALRAVLGPGDVGRLRRAAAAVHVDDAVKAYAAAIVRATRSHPQARLGASPRATLHLLRAAQALALIEGLPLVSPDAVKRLAAPVLGHRVLLTPTAQLAGHDGPALVESVVAATPAPTLPR